MRMKHRHDEDKFIESEIAIIGSSGISSDILASWESESCPIRATNLDPRLTMHIPVFNSILSNTLSNNMLHAGFDLEKE